MQRIAVIARLKPNAEKRATELIETGPPFDPDKLGFDRHSVYLSGNQAVFVFEGGRLDHLLHTAGPGSRQRQRFGSVGALHRRLPDRRARGVQLAARKRHGGWGE